jgi:hypothetical protein
MWAMMPMLRVFSSGKLRGIDPLSTADVTERRNG